MLAEELHDGRDGGLEDTAVRAAGDFVAFVRDAKLLQLCDQRARVLHRNGAVAVAMDGIDRDVVLFEIRERQLACRRNVAADGDRREASPDRRSVPTFFDARSHPHATQKLRRGDGRDRGATEVGGVPRDDDLRADGLGGDGLQRILEIAHRQSERTTSREPAGGGHVQRAQQAIQKSAGERVVVVARQQVVDIAQAVPRQETAARVQATPLQQLRGLFGKGLARKAEIQEHIAIDERDHRTGFKYFLRRCS